MTEFVKSGSARAGMDATGLSIASILIAVITFITLGVMSAAGVVGYTFFRAQERAELETMGQAVSEQAAMGLSLPLWNYDETQVKKTAESILRVRSVRAVVVRQGSKDAIFLALGREGHSGSVLKSAPVLRAGDMSISKEILFAGDKIGNVELLVSSEQLDARLALIRRWMWGLIGGVTALLSGALYWLLWKITLKPIRILEKYSQQVNQESFENTPVVAEKFHGELDSLRGSIVKMVELLQERYAGLKQETRRYSESEKRFRTLVNTIPDLIWLKDVDGVYLSCNRMFERFFGAAETEIVGKTDYDFVPKELADFFREYDQAAMAAAGPSRNEEWVNFADDGRRVLLETTKTPMYDADGKLVGVLGIGRDITHRKQAEDERREFDERMNNIQKLEALGVLVAGVAHNINNVLAAIMGSASLRENQVTDPEDRETYAMIATASRRGRDVVKSLLQFSRPTLSNQAPVELNGLLVEVRKLLESTTRNRVRIVEEFTGTPLWIHGDAGSITNSFMNLCINAMDAMPEGGVITLRTTLVDKNWIEASVEDTGLGIPPEILARVMEPFFTTKEVGKGTGLGLSMTHGVVKVHGGSMEISSEPAKGTVVRIRLPRIAAPDGSDAAQPVRIATGSLNVLLVDDDQDIRFLVARMLKAAKHTVSVVPGGQEALDFIKSNPLPDLVIMDQNMPGLDGIQTMEKIREMHADLPILISSGQPDIQEWECFKRSKVGVISKPFDMRELTEKLDGFASENRL